MCSIVFFFTRSGVQGQGRRPDLPHLVGRLQVWIRTQPDCAGRGPETKVLLPAPVPQTSRLLQRHILQLPHVRRGPGLAQQKGYCQWVQNGAGITSSFTYPFFQRLMSPSWATCSASCSPSTPLTGVGSPSRFACVCWPSPADSSWGRPSYTDYCSAGSSGSKCSGLTR